MSRHEFVHGLFGVAFGALVLEGTLIVASLGIAKAVALVVVGATAVGVAFALGNLLLWRHE